MYLYELRNLWQLFFHVTVGAFVTLQIWLRQAQGKAPDYDVWHHPSDILPCLKEEKEGKHHCDEETVDHKWELRFLSLQLSFLSQPSMPVSMQYLVGKLFSTDCWPWLYHSEEDKETSLQCNGSGRTVRCHWKTWPAALNHGWRIQSKSVCGTCSENQAGTLQPRFAFVRH